VLLIFELKMNGLFTPDAVTDSLAASAPIRASVTSAIIDGNCDSIMHMLKNLPICSSAMVAVAVLRFTQAYMTQPPLAPHQILELAQNLFAPIM
jgi:nitrate reductase cytochrome c-type subunit